MYDIVLIEKESLTGLTKEDIKFLFEKCNDLAVFPVQYSGKKYSNVALGFISEEAADKIDYCYDLDSALNDFIALILDETYTTCEFEFCKLSVFMLRKNQRKDE